MTTNREINGLQRQTAGETVFPADVADKLARESVQEKRINLMHLYADQVPESIECALTARNGDFLFLRDVAGSTAGRAAHYAFLTYPELREHETDPRINPATGFFREIRVFKPSVGLLMVPRCQSCGHNPIDAVGDICSDCADSRRAEARKDFDALYPAQQQLALRQDLGHLKLNRSGFPAETPLEFCGICAQPAPDGSGICDACHKTMIPAKPSAALPWLHYEEFRGLQMVIARRKFEKEGR